MRNLLKETLAVMEQYALSESTVQWVGSEKYWTTWKNFKEIADVTYSPGFGAAEIPTDLIIVGDTWWMSRGEYDGSEWWDLHTPPIKPADFGPLKKVHGGTWSSLEDLNPHLRGE